MYSHELNNFIRHPIWDFQMKFSGLLQVVLIYPRQSYILMTSVELGWTHVHLLKLLMLNIRTNNVQVIIWLVQTTHVMPTVYFPMQ